MRDEKNISLLKKIKADELFPDFLSDEDRRQIRILRSKAKKKAKEDHAEQRKQTVKEAMSVPVQDFDLQVMV